MCGASGQSITYYTLALDVDGTMFHMRRLFNGRGGEIRTPGLHVPNVVTRCSMVLCGAVTCWFVLPGATVDALPFHVVSRPTTPLDVLPVGWFADIGAPVELADGTVLWMYGDTWHPDGFSRNTIIVDGQVITDAVPATASGSVYWPGDAVELPDGRLFVVMGEVADDLTASQEVRDAGMAFAAVDTDAFIVTDPTSPMSWKLATKIDDGPWGEGSVYFSDQWPIAFVRQPGSFMTEAWRYDPANPTADWEQLDVSLPESFGTFTAVQTADGWWGVVASDWTRFALWHADSLDGDWEAVEGFETVGRSYDHQLNVVAGRVVHRWSNASPYRPAYLDVTDELGAPTAADEPAVSLYPSEAELRLVVEEWREENRPDLEFDPMLEVAVTYCTGETDPVILSMLIDNGDLSGNVLDFLTGVCPQVIGAAAAAL